MQKDKLSKIELQELAHNSLFVKFMHYLFDQIGTDYIPNIDCEEEYRIIFQYKAILSRSILTLFKGNEIFIKELLYRNYNK